VSPVVSNPQSPSNIVPPTQNIVDQNAKEKKQPEGPGALGQVNKAAELVNKHE
jgi:hypothetical protein